MRKLQIILLVFWTPFFLNAQTFEEYKKQREKELNKTHQDIDSYYATKDKEFEEYLKQQWVSFDVSLGIESSTKPKLSDVPQYSLNENSRNRKIQTIKPNSSPRVLESDLAQNSELIVRRIDENITLKSESMSLAIDFYGISLAFSTREFVFPQEPQKLSGEIFSDWWKQASDNNYAAILMELVNYKTELKLNDWAYYHLVQTLSENLNNSAVNQKLFIWFMLNHSGYDARLAHVDDKISLLIPVKQQLYHLTHIEMESSIYYLMDNWESSKIKTYNRSFAPATRIMDFNLYESLIIGNSIESRDFTILNGSDSITFKMDYNPYWISLFKTYPQGDLTIFFNASVSPEAKRSIIKNLSPIIESMSEKEALDFLLGYVQYGFHYKRDNDQFGYEKFLFPEETLYYNYSDCEDRAIYFAWLVRELLDLKVVGLKYKGHIATAVAISEDVQGDFIEFRDQKYFIADPTYLGSPLGVTMKEYYNEIPEIIAIY